MHVRSFGSDNFSGVHPSVFKALEEAAYGHQHSYGDDIYTEKAVADFKALLGDDIEVYFVYNGTGANVLALSAFLEPYHSVICTETAHIRVDECGALSHQTGCVMLTVPSFDGKLTVEAMHNHLHGFGDQHHTQPRMISISECSELGTIYTPEEVKALADEAHAHGMYLHMDGARIANAVAALGCDVRDLTRNAGVDVLSFGGTKNGMMFGEAVVFFTRPPKEPMYVRKQLTQLHSKGRFIAAQFSAVLHDDLWLQLAAHSNRMAAMLAHEAAMIPGITITQEVRGNEVFAQIPPDAIAPLQEEYFFYVWAEDASEVRWVCSFDTTENDIVELVALLRKVIIK